MPLDQWSEVGQRVLVTVHAVPDLRAPEPNGVLAGVGVEDPGAIARSLLEPAELESPHTLPGPSVAVRLDREC
jgi:hypothetical protein